MVGGACVWTAAKGERAVRRRRAYESSRIYIRRWRLPHEHELALALGIALAATMALSASLDSAARGTNLTAVYLFGTSLLCKLFSDPSEPPGSGLPSRATSLARPSHPKGKCREAIEVVRRECDEKAP